MVGYDKIRCIAFFCTIQPLLHSPPPPSPFQQAKDVKKSWPLRSCCASLVVTRDWNQQALALWAYQPSSPPHQRSTRRHRPVATGSLLDADKTRRRVFLLPLTTRISVPPLCMFVTSVSVPRREGADARSSIPEPFAPMTYLFGKGP